ncbi:hypothetical protein J6590_007867 [Homalodisca vitripennis]|nr:hypothetical protein J6590_007867 [Homalodisca vitripennis]
MLYVTSRAGRTDETGGRLARKNEGARQPPVAPRSHHPVSQRSSVYPAPHGDNDLLGEDDEDERVMGLRNSGPPVTTAILPARSSKGNKVERQFSTRLMVLIKKLRSRTGFEPAPSLTQTLSPTCKINDNLKPNNDDTAAVPDWLRSRPGLITSLAATTNKVMVNELHSGPTKCQAATTNKVMVTELQLKSTTVYNRTMTTQLLCYIGSGPGSALLHLKISDNLKPNNDDTASVLYWLRSRLSFTTSQVQQPIKSCFCVILAQVQAQLYYISSATTNKVMVTELQLQNCDNLKPNNDDTASVLYWLRSRLSFTTSQVQQPIKSCNCCWFVGGCGARLAQVQIRRYHI